MRTLLTFTLLVAVAPVVGCAHQPSAPQVTIMRSGPIYPSRPENCALTFINNQHIDILSSGYEQLGMIALAGTTEQMAGVEAQIPGAVAGAACKMGGTSVSLANALATQSTSILQFSVWREPSSAPTKSPEPPTKTQGI